MAFKRALVVDDSRSARISLKRLLEEQDLEVFSADCGEAAIDLLRGDLVDVIFMDHNMPGMDGLEALTAIKSDPRTATIPVMMYTTKEGEVYVSQARALGALGVLPKTFQPHVLFDMLLELGLVTDRRNSSDTPPPTTPAEMQRRERGPDPERASEHQAIGISVQTLVKRILEDQHLSLRADILQSHRDFAKKVAAEVIEAQRPIELDDDDEQITTSPPRPAARSNLTTIVGVLFAAALIVVSSLYWQTLESQSRLSDALSRSNAQIDTLEETLQLALQPSEPPAATNDTARELDTLTWAANRGAQVDFDEPAFSADAAVRLETLIEQLLNIGFRGLVVVESHLGEFCLVSNEAGGYELAPEDFPMLGCSLVGHPLDNSSFPEQRQDEAFQAFISDLAATGPEAVQLQLIAHDRLNTEPLADYPRSPDSAGEWNQAARQNHRLEISFVPEP